MKNVESAVISGNLKLNLQLPGNPVRLTEIRQIFQQLQIELITQQHQQTTLICSNRRAINNDNKYNAVLEKVALGTSIDFWQETKDKRNSTAAVTATKRLHLPFAVSLAHRKIYTPIWAVIRVMGTLELLRR